MDVVDQMQGKRSPSGKGFGQHVGQRPAQESRRSSGNTLELRGQVTAGLANTAQAQAIEMSKTIKAARAFNRKNAGLLAKEIKAIASGEDFTIQLIEALTEECQDLQRFEFPEFDWSDAEAVVAELGKTRALPTASATAVGFLPPGVI